jgi:shikimate dehydrogenase
LAPRQFGSHSARILYALHEQGLGTLYDDGTVSLQGYNAILLGAGGAARAAAFALAESGVEQLAILNRHLERAQLLATELQQYYDRPIFSLSDPTFLIPRTPSIIINATSAGMHGDDSPLPVEILSRFDGDTFVYDMIYNPTQTFLLCQARLMGIPTANGLSMLLHQGALSFTLWTNQPAPIEVMRQSLLM